MTHIHAHADLSLVTVHTEEKQCVWSEYTHTVAKTIGALKYLVIQKRRGSDPNSWLIPIGLLGYLESIPHIISCGHALFFINTGYHLSSPVSECSS